MPVPPDYRIIYNWDGAPHGYSPVPQSLEDFLEKVYAPLEDTQVGALFWSAGRPGFTLAQRGGGIYRRRSRASLLQCRSVQRY